MEKGSEAQRLRSVYNFMHQVYIRKPGFKPTQMTLGPSTVLHGTVQIEANS